jgi:hypothetical protein
MMAEVCNRKRQQEIGCMEWIFWLALLAFQVAFALGSGSIAQSKGRSAESWFFLTLLLMGVFGTILVALLPPLYRQGSGHQVPSQNAGFFERRCMRCGTNIDMNAEVCPVCAARLPS